MQNITAESDEELYNYFLGLKDDIATNLFGTDISLEGLTPYRYSSQVVAGTNYDILYTFGDAGNDLLEVKVY